MHNLLHHLPILQVALPLTMSVLCAILTSPVAAWLLVTISVLASFMISLMLFFQLETVHNISYALGGWQPPIGIEYKIDALNALFLVLISFIALMSILYSLKITDKELNKTKLPLFYSLFLFCFTGFLGIVITNDIFNIYVFLEIAYLSSYALIAMGADKKASVAGFQYLIIGSIAAIFILLGIGFLYMMTGTLNISDIAKRLTVIHHFKIVKTAIIFITLGLLLKMAFFPVHKWLPNIYGYAPAMMAAFISGISSTAVIYLLIRLIFTIISAEVFAKHFAALIWILQILAVVTIIIGGIYSLREKNFRKLLAYSTISQIGYILLALVTSVLNHSTMLLTAGILFMIYHAVTKSALLMTGGYYNIYYNSQSVNNLRTITRLGIPGCIAINSANLAAIPITLGFSAKFMLFTGLAQYKHWYLLLAAVAGSIITLIYTGKIIFALYINDTDIEKEQEHRHKPDVARAVIIAITLVNIWLAVKSDMLTNYSGNIAHYLLNHTRGAISDATGK